MDTGEQSPRKRDRVRQRRGNPSDEGDSVTYVIDASAAAKLFIIEEYSNKAIDLVNAHALGHLSLSAPSLIVYELGNVFWKHPKITPEKLYEFIKRFLDLQITLVNIYSTIDLLKTVCNISKSRDVTFYDASYLAVAEKHGTKLVTADEKIHNKVSDLTIPLEEFKV